MRRAWDVSGYRSGAATTPDSGGEGSRQSAKAGVRSRKLAVALCGLTPSLIGCATVGPATLRESRPSYNEAVADTGKLQALMNIVRVHNNESPAFVDVSEVDDLSILSGTSGGTISNLWAKAGPLAAITGSATYSQSPNIKFVPLQGLPLAQQLSSPIPPETLAALFNSDWPIENVLNLAADRLTPGYRDYDAALHQFAALDDIGAINLAATVSDWLI